MPGVHALGELCACTCPGRGGTPIGDARWLAVVSQRVCVCVCVCVCVGVCVHVEKQTGRQACEAQHRQSRVGQARPTSGSRQTNSSQGHGNSPCLVQQAASSFRATFKRMPVHILIPGASVFSFFMLGCLCWVACAFVCPCMCVCVWCACDSKQHTGLRRTALWASASGSRARRRQSPGGVGCLPVSVCVCLCVCSAAAVQTRGRPSQACGCALLLLSAAQSAFAIVCLRAAPAMRGHAAHSWCAASLVPTAAAAAAHPRGRCLQQPGSGVCLALSVFGVCRRRTNAAARACVCTGRGQACGVRDVACKPMACNACVGHAHAVCTCVVLFDCGCLQRAGVAMRMLGGPVCPAGAAERQTVPWRA
jgi:hypothetical protein